VSRRLAFDFLCRLLSLEESHEPYDCLNRAAQPHGVFWSDMVSLASEQRVSAAVWPALCRKRAVGDLPKDVADYFEGVATLNRMRNAKILSEAIELTGILNDVGAIPIFLKGGANLLSGLYPDSAMRTGRPIKPASKLEKLRQSTDFKKSRRIESDDCSTCRGGSATHEAMTRSV
jgi:hypothetical protein